MFHLLKFGWPRHLSRFCPRELVSHQTILPNALLDHLPTEKYLFRVVYHLSTIHRSTSLIIYLYLTIWPSKYTMTIFSVVNIFPHILTSIRPNEYPLAVHFTVFPVALILFTTTPLKFPKTIHFVVYKLSRIEVASALKDSLTLLYSFMVRSLVSGPIWPYFLTLSMLKIIRP